MDAVGGSRHLTGSWRGWSQRKARSHGRKSVGKWPRNLVLPPYTQRSKRVGVSHRLHSFLTGQLSATGLGYAPSLALAARPGWLTPPIGVQEVSAPATQRSKRASRSARLYNAQHRVAHEAGVAAGPEIGQRPPPSDLTFETCADVMHFALSRCRAITARIRPRPTQEQRCGPVRILMAIGQRHANLLMPLRRRTAPCGRPWT